MITLSPKRKNCFFFRVPCASSNCVHRLKCAFSLLVIHFLTDFFSFLECPRLLPQNYSDSHTPIQPHPKPTAKKTSINLSFFSSFDSLVTDIEITVDSNRKFFQVHLFKPENYLKRRHPHSRRNLE